MSVHMKVRKDLNHVAVLLAKECRNSVYKKKKKWVKGLRLKHLETEHWWWDVAYGIKVKFSFEHFHDGLSEGKYVC